VEGVAELKNRLYAALKHEKSCTCGECSGGLNAVDDLVKHIELLEGELRRELWLNHGHGYEAMYGDDEEMACNACPADFKREPIVQLLARVYAVRLVIAAAIQKDR